MNGLQTCPVSFRWWGLIWTHSHHSKSLQKQANKNGCVGHWEQNCGDHSKNRLLIYVNRFGLSAATVSYFKLWGNLLPPFCLLVLTFRAPYGAKQMKRDIRCIIKIDRFREHLHIICYLRQRFLIVLNYWWCFVRSKEWDVLLGMFYSVFAARSKFVL